MRIEGLGLYGGAGFGYMEQYVERRLLCLFKEPSPMPWDGDGS